jgi:NADH-quinone oxidoreductase subunit J
LELDAQFAGFAQILVYIGAVAILVVFAILLTQGLGNAQGRSLQQQLARGLVIAAAVFAVLGWAVLQSARALPHETAPPGDGACRLAMR